MAGLVRPDDLMLVNRAGADFQTEVRNLVKPISDHEPLPGPGPWDGADATYHVIVSNAARFKVIGQDKIYNLADQTEASTIDAAGEWVITGVNTKFTSNYDIWDFGALTDTSNVTDMSNMFYDCFDFNSDISNWNTSNVTNMNNMFYNAEQFNSDISSWQVGNVKDMYHMFDSAAKFNSAIGNWDVGNVEDMDYMFSYATVFNQNLSGWCVDPEPTHVNFDNSARGWTEPRPVWGTCP